MSNVNYAEVVVWLRDGADDWLWGGIFAGGIMKGALTWLRFPRYRELEPSGSRYLSERTVLLLRCSVGRYHETTVQVPKLYVLSSLLAANLMNLDGQ